MSTFRAVPRYPEPMPDRTYSEWLDRGVKDATGVIDIANDAQRHGFIKPDLYPEERLYFRFEDWPNNVRKKKMVGERVMFDLAPQYWHDGIKGVASHVRFVPE
jgi:hypothetical protein